MLLPRLKQRALEQMHEMLKRWSRQKGWLQSSEQADQIKQLMDLQSSPSSENCPDWAQLADCWLDLVRPVWSEHLKHRGRKAVVTRLKDIQRDLLYSKLVTTRDESTIEAMSKWEDAVGERVHLPKLKNKIVHIDHAKWGLREQESVRNTIARFPELAPGYQGFLTKKSTALTDIAGAMIRTHPWSEEQIGLGKFSHTSESKAELVQE